VSFGFGAGVSLVSRGGCLRSSGSADARSSERRTGWSLGAILLAGAAIFLGMNLCQTGMRVAREEGVACVQSVNAPGREDALRNWLPARNNDPLQISGIR
jgi:hypothetical protein